MGSSSCRFARHLKLYIFYIRIFFQGFFLGSDFQFVSECESRWIWNVCAGIERSLLWRHIFANALVAKRIKKTCIHVNLGSNDLSNGWFSMYIREGIFGNVPSARSSRFKRIWLFVLAICLLQGIGAKCFCLCLYQSLSGGNSSTHRKLITVVGKIHPLKRLARN